MKIRLVTLYQNANELNIVPKLKLAQVMIPLVRKQKTAKVAPIAELPNKIENFPQKNRLGIT